MPSGPNKIVRKEIGAEAENRFARRSRLLQPATHKRVSAEWQSPRVPMAA